VAGRTTGLGCAGSFDGIERVALALTAPYLPVRAVDLHDLDPRRSEQPGEASTVGAGALHPDARKQAERFHPADETVFTCPIRVERFRGQQAADLVEDSRHVDVEVCIDSACDTASWFYDDGHRHPYLPLVKGWCALTSTMKRVSVGLLEQDDRPHRRRE
jgi:hypothetical protein